MRAWVIKSVDGEYKGEFYDKLNTDYGELCYATLYKDKSETEDDIDTGYIAVEVEINEI